MNSKDTAVLFLVFNRIETTRIVFEKIKKFKPMHFFVAADGYRRSKPEEKGKCENVRQYVLDNIDWDCNLHILFRDTNLGCGKAVSEAIKWFFEHVNEGIIIEDDCVLDDTFFLYCSQLLEKYRYNEKVGLIGSVYFHNPDILIKDSYYFSIYPEVWGWATWKRTLDKYDYSMKQWENINKRKFLRSKLRNKGFVNYWVNIFNLTYSKKIDTWDYQLVFACWLNDLLTIIPTKNLVKNIGINADGTHFSETNTFFSELKSESLDFPLIHPSKIAQNVTKDRHTQILEFGTIRNNSKILTYFKRIKKVIVSKFLIWISF